MMSICRCYKVHKKLWRSQQLTPDPDGAETKIIETPWCSHDPSPRPRSSVHSQRAKPLRCGGDLDNCPLPPDQRPSPSP
jgi:hypothetical protein